MSLKTVAASLLKYLLLVALYFAGNMARSILIPNGVQAPPPDQMPAVFGGLLLMALVNTFVVSLVITRSSWGGWRLVAATAFAWYGAMTFLAAIEAAWFGPSLGISSQVPVALLLGEGLLVLVFTPVAVLVWGKGRPAAAPDTHLHVPLTAGEWAWKLAVAAVVYLVLYFGFGYVVAWQNPALRDMYGSGANQVVFNYAFLIPLQVGRSALWVLFALPVIRMNRGPLWETALLVALLLALPMNIGHFIPNMIMPDPTVRLSHFIETATSTFIFGLFVTWLLGWRPVRTAVKSAPPIRP